jgi:hypothetical protein
MAFMDTVKKWFGSAKEKTEEVAPKAWEKTKDVAGDVAEKTGDVAGKAWEKTKDVAGDIKERFDEDKPADDGGEPPAGTA